MHISALASVLRIPDAVLASAPGQRTPSSNVTPPAEAHPAAKPMTETASPSLVGRVNANPKGFGFVTTEAGEEFFVSPSDMRRLVPGDVVSFRPVAGRMPDSFQAQVDGIVSRAATVWLGELSVDGDRFLLVPDAATPCFVTLVLEASPDATAAHARGEVVSVRVPALSPGKSLHRPGARVAVRLERNLGVRTRPGFLQDFALAKHDFAVSFSEEALQQATAASQAALNLEGREDLRAMPLVTIDGESTRDFDDAVHAKELTDGWELTVAIADVSHYVPPGSALDAAARERATSVYLPGLVSPMLPEALSNGACSLLPEADRLAVVLHLRLNKVAEVVETRVSRAVVRSAQRLTYDQVQAWSENAFSAHPVVESSLRALWAVFKACDAARAARGRLDFDSPEPKAALDENGEFTLEWVYRTEAHRLVEELMLLANRAVAQALGERARALFRHQPLPEQERWATVQAFAQVHGLPLPEAPEMQGLAALVQGAGPELALKAELRARGAMSPACYSESEPGHFSLNFAAYTHFTSPIRRYADLLVHRLLLGLEPGNAEELEDLALHCSERSRAARLAERGVWDAIKKGCMWREHLSNPQPLLAHVVAQSRRGARVVVPRWQVAVLLEGEHLQAQGYRYDSDLDAWTSPQDVLELGTSLTVELQRFVEDGSRQEVLAVRVCGDESLEFRRL